MIKNEIFFCGLSKNNFEPLKKNISFLLDYINNSKYKNFKIIVVDSDSDDGSKDYLNALNKKHNQMFVVHEDNLSNEMSRIEKIKICRNLCLDKINELKNSENTIYIPLDLDLNLFSKSTYQKMDTLIDYVLLNNKAIFPISQPYYYDIFALRAKGWVNFNAQLFNNKLKSFFKIGSFIFNYIFIFRNQLNPLQIEKKDFKVRSAFGGAGIYNISKIDLTNQRYFTSNTNVDWYSEHLFFNSNFDILELRQDWIIESPKEHVQFKVMKFSQKIRYILRTLKHDVEKMFFKN